MKRKSAVLVTNAASKKAKKAKKAAVSNNFSVQKGEDGIARCSWCLSFELYRNYHDNEWGNSKLYENNDNKLFEALALESFQAGLSWAIILKKREGFRQAFSNFNVDKVSSFNSKNVEKMLNNVEIVRHRGKIENAIEMAKAIKSRRKKNRIFLIIFTFLFFIIIGIQNGKKNGFSDFIFSNYQGIH